MNRFKYYVVGAWKAFAFACSRLTTEKSSLITKSMVAGLIPLARDKWKLEKPILPLSRPKVVISEVEITADETGQFVKITGIDETDVGVTLEGLPSDERFAGQTFKTIMVDGGGLDVMFLPPDHVDVAGHYDAMAGAASQDPDLKEKQEHFQARALESRDLREKAVAKFEGEKKSIGKALEGAAKDALDKVRARTAVAALRPTKFKDKKLGESELGSQNLALESKKDGVGLLVTIDGNGKCVSIVDARSGKVDHIDAFPEIRDHEFHESVRDSRVWIEGHHSMGLHSMTGLLNSGTKNAQAFIDLHGHPTAFVLGVLKNGGHDTRNLKYKDMRGLRELVATKIPHGKMPSMCDGDYTQKQAFVAKLFKAARDHNPQVDGVVAIKKDVPFKDLVIGRAKPPFSAEVILMGFEPSKKIQGAAGAFIYGDGQNRLGEVNIADPNMRVAVFQNPRRYEGKVATIGGLRRFPNGKVFQPKLEEIKWEGDASMVKPWDAEAGLKQEVAAMEPDPTKRDLVMFQLKSDGGRLRKTA